MQLQKQNTSGNISTINKHDLCDRIRKYIVHSEKIMMLSHHASYRSPGKLNALVLVKDTVYKMVKNPDNWNLKDITRWTLMVRERLMLLLPDTRNKSYEHSRENLQQILDECSSYNKQFDKV